MMRKYSFSDVIDLWPSAVDLARELDLKVVTVRAWRARGIPARYWTAIVTAAHRRGHADVTVEALAAMAAARRRLPGAVA